MTKFAPLALLLAAAAAAMPAGAATFTFTAAGNGTVAPGFTLLNNFNAGTGLTGSGFGYYTTNISGEAAMPFGSDGSRYVAVRNGGSATAAFGADVRRFSLYIGSLDASNRIDFNYADGSSDFLLGSNLTPPADGNQTSTATNGLFTFTGTNAKVIRSVTFGSGVNSFEFDDLATSTAAVPEPATWAMMILGFGMVGGAARRRRATPAMAAA